MRPMSKVCNTMEWEKIWNLNKKIIDPIAPRYTCVDQFRIPVIPQLSDPLLINALEVYRLQVSGATTYLKVLWPLQ